MRMVDLIEKKRDGEVLKYEEIKYIIDSYVANEIPDYQISSLLMAIYFRGMNDEETTNLALIMKDSGDSLDLSGIDGIKVDKHSTGGVGDKTTLVLGPIVAACGARFAKMSGRGLGHTGGTIDKLEAIPGYKVKISEEDFIKQVNDIGVAVVGQSKNLTPADKKLYALRDVTGTVPSIPLIASSIMSKKLASGADAICLDVKVGAGAFMKNIEDAKRLASLMVSIGENCGRKMTAILTNMDEPLGKAVGNNLEVIEAIETLQGRGPKDLVDLCVEIAGYLLVDASIVNNIKEGKKKALEVIENGLALEKLYDMVEAQGGNKDYITNPNLFEKAKNIIEIKSESSGYIKEVDALKIGHMAMVLGAGRAVLEDTIDFSAGIVLNKKTGDKVEVGDVLAYAHTNKDINEDYINDIKDAFIVSNKHYETKLIIDVIRTNNC